jgi:urate oxidase
MVATSIKATWRYAMAPRCYEAAYAAAKAGLVAAFYGPVKGGVFSPSVQFTLFQMGKEVLQR